MIAIGMTEIVIETVTVIAIDGTAAAIAWTQTIATGTVIGTESDGDEIRMTMAREGLAS
jgi:hypothetical protein